MEKETQIPTPHANSDPSEIDLLALVKILWHDRKIVLYSILISGLLGLLIAVLTPNQYTAKVVFVPQLKTDSSAGGLSGLAAMAGINIGISQSSSEISPIIYPLIVTSIPFQLELMNTPLKFKNSPNSISVLEYITSTRSSFDPIGLIRKYTIGLPSLIINTFKGDKKVSYSSVEEEGIIKLTADQKSVKSVLESIIELTINNKEGYVTVKVSMTDALSAAQMTQKTVDLLQKYIIDFKIKKAKAELDFIQERFNEKKIEFEKAQESLALRIDRNKNFTSGLSSIETDRLQAKYTLTFGVYQELAKQLEQGKIQVKKETPVFAIIEPVTIPSVKSNPNRTKILFISLFFGTAIITCFVIGKKYFPILKNHLLNLDLV